MVVKKVAQCCVRLIFITFCFYIIGCAHTPELVEQKFNTEVEYLGMKKMPLRVAMVLPEEVEYYVIKSKPVGGSEVPHLFSLGKALMNISKNIFSQVFEELQVVRESPDFKSYNFAIEPKITDFQFGYKGVECWSKISVAIKVYNDTKTIWTRNIESPVVKQATYSASGKFRDPYAATGTVASDAIKAVFKTAVSQIVILGDIKKISENVKMRKAKDSDFE